MATFLIKINGTLHGLNHVVRPRQASDWEGSEVATMPPQPLRAGRAAGDIRTGDELLIWTHESPEYGGGSGLTARARASAVTPNGDTVVVQIKEVQLFDPPIGLMGVNRAGLKNEVLEAVHGRRHFRTILLHDDELAEFEAAIRERQGYKQDVINELNEMAKSPLARALGEDARQIDEAYERQFQMREARPGQAAFRQVLLVANGYRCALSGCRMIEVLEACHIVPFSEEVVFRYDIRNGLVLRADLHRLFDSQRLSINPSTLKVVLAPHIQSKNYQRLTAEPIRLTASRELLNRHFDRFQSRWQSS